MHRRLFAFRGVGHACAPAGFLHTLSGGAVLRLGVLGPSLLWRGGGEQHTMSQMPPDLWRTAILLGRRAVPVHHGLFGLRLYLWAGK